MASAANPLGWQQQPDHLSANASQPGWERARPAATPNYAPPPHREEWSQGPSAGYGRPGPGHGMPDTSQPVLRPEFHYQPDFRAAPVPIGLSHTFDGGFRPNFPVRPRPRSPGPRFGAARLWDSPALCLPPPLLRASIAPFERRWAFCPGEGCPSCLCQDGARASQPSESTLTALLPEYLYTICTVVQYPVALGPRSSLTSYPCAPRQHHNGPWERPGPPGAYYPPPSRPPAGPPTQPFHDPRRMVGPGPSVATSRGDWAGSVRPVYGVPSSPPQATLYARANSPGGFHGHGRDAGRPPYPAPYHASPLRASAASPPRPASASGWYPLQGPGPAGFAAPRAEAGGPGRMPMGRLAGDGEQRSRQQLSASMDNVTRSHNGRAEPRQPAKASPNLVRRPPT